ncbi:hypothetical protein [Magnetofaba australis]|uniref:DUF4178 domain-containing protein n=1 Tax=Magnetofaba australis IT-1 TaxID=1434232 RepID=A0A1Y2K9J6_9PROT|nr:hypothetical protein [Magnetofaba australis]OSM07156.1 hypothetical protein MAIT1_03926 [Magnetofaba australis IT-1]
MSPSNLPDNHPRNLRIGDLAQFSVLPEIPELSERAMEVTDIWTLDLQGETRTLFQLRDDRNRLYTLEVTADWGDRALAVGRELSRGEVGQLLPLDKLAEMFGEAVGVRMERVSEPDAFKGWTAPSYVQSVDAWKGYWLDGDYRHKRLPTYEEGLLEVDCYALRDDTGLHGFDAEVFANSETRIRALVFLPDNAITPLRSGQGSGAA